MCDGTGGITQSIDTLPPPPTQNNHAYEENEAPIPEVGYQTGIAPAPAHTSQEIHQFPDSKPATEAQPRARFNFSAPKLPPTETVVFYVVIVWLLTLGAVGLYFIYALGIERTLVVAAIFLLFSTWFTLRTLQVLGEVRNPAVNRSVVFVAIAVGLTLGTVIVHRVVTTNEGIQIIAWITGSVMRSVVTLFSSIFTVSIIDWLLRRLVESLFRRE